MKKRIFRYLKHLIATVLIIGTAAILFGLYHGASAHYGDHPLMYKIDKEGPYVFYQNDSTLNINYVKGNRDDGFYVDKKEYAVNSEIMVKSYFQIDSTSFDFKIDSDIKTPQVTYNDGNPIIAISDIEGSYKTFRDFLISNKVIDSNLNWTFGKGHLVLVGDFVDRGWSVTQVLWFIYKLEQEAAKQGGVVHFIIGNHELKNMQGDYKASADKYLAVANILGKVQSDLYNRNSFLGKWLASKNAIELINGNLFAHGGIHPEVADSGLSLDKVNQIIRSAYYKPYYPKTEKSVENLLKSTKKGICWYRGYFKEDLSQEQVELGINKFNARTIVVGHTLQSKVNRQYNGKVIGIDVKHPKDYQKHWPFGKTEGLLIEGDSYYRVLSNGEKEEM
ncbi:metallophosphoesterase [Muriicola sp. Z0-33]|uniref:metallophosphoesterase n=1 Tax=Muriicola sp. Z0-33 TaxID=2816957 RepID=UPI002238A4B7|nr:metallophosphoesterase [Muriicola sp. Z0-33]MCW5517954.1 metallophosphoesterase [Muriicola sp. Z0-33]